MGTRPPMGHGTIGNNTIKAKCKSPKIMNANKTQKTKMNDPVARYQNLMNTREKHKAYSSQKRKPSNSVNKVNKSKPNFDVKPSSAV
jgi:hypothetical protein